MEYLDEEFKQRQWSLYVNTDTERVYRKKDCDFFVIKKSPKGNISVSFPLKNSEYNFATEFDNYTKAYDYVVEKLKYLDEDTNTDAMSTKTF